MNHELLMGDGLGRNAHNLPLKIAAVDGYRRIAYGVLNSRVDRLAHGPLSLGLKKASSYKVPKSVEFVESLPHTEVGKVNKVKVREMFLHAAAQSSRNVDSSPVFS